MPLHERLALGSCEYSRRRADRADAARTQCTGHAQAVFGVVIIQKTMDVTRGKGIAATAAIHEWHRIGTGFQAQPLGNQYDALATQRDDGRARAQAVKLLCLLERVLFTR